MTGESEIISKLDNIKQELDYIKEHMVEKDELINEEEFEAYKRSFDKENLISLEEAKKHGVGLDKDEFS